MWVKEKIGQPPIFFHKCQCIYATGRCHLWYESSGFRYDLFTSCITRKLDTNDSGQKVKKNTHHIINSNKCDKFCITIKNKTRYRIIHEYYILVILSLRTNEVIVTFALQIAGIFLLQNPNLSPIIDAWHSTKVFLASLRKLNTNYFIFSLRYCISTTPFYTKNHQNSYFYI